MNNPLVLVDPSGLTPCDQCLPPGHPKNKCKNAGEYWCGNVDCNTAVGKLTCLVYGEAGGTPDACVAAVTNVMLNRGNRSKRGLDVVFDKSQFNAYQGDKYNACCSGCFTGTPGGVMLENKARLRTSDIVWPTYYFGPDTSRGATHFYSPTGKLRRRMPDWASEMREVSIAKCPKRKFRFFK
jgi:hypothetical protein